ncbi:helix-turn-helix transcriptional regulator [Pedobacter sp. UBA4863]|uniref:helix-turn-helix domain-containing protein n=1 Tax=Pedobacter sp. UBA4863 TaxID=1947060 RepID=UPI0025E76456|nr:helix-turn-helix transcriptional regulator [Pedobacter sp. UBA4863]
MENLEELRLKEKLDGLRLMADEMPIAIIVHRIADLSVVYMNKVGLAILGIDLQELQTIDSREYVSRYFHQDDDADYTAKIQHNLMHKPSMSSSYFQQVKSKDGNWQLFASSSKVFLEDDNQQPTHLITTASPLDPAHHISEKITRLMNDIRFLRNNAMAFGKLTVRETEILKMMALGLSSTEIAQKLFIALATVDTHRRNVRQKLNLKNNYDAVRFAQAFDLV